MLTMAVSLALLCPIFAASDHALIEHRLSEDVLVIEENFWDGHLIAVRTGEGIVVVDTFPSQRLAKEARGIIERTFPGQPFKYVITTDSHWDHNCGNQAFADAVIIAHHNSVESMKIDVETTVPWFNNEADRLAEGLESLDPDSEEAKNLRHEVACYRQIATDLAQYVYTPPDITISGNAEIRLGGKTFSIFYFGPAHTSSDCAVLVGEERLLITGDLAFHRAMSVIDTSVGGNAIGYQKAQAALLLMQDKYDRVVPGHGPIGDVQVIKDYQKLLSDFDAAVRDAGARGLDLEQAQKEIKMEQYSGFKWYSERSIANLVAAFWQALETEGK